MFAWGWLRHFWRRDDGAMHAKIPDSISVTEDRGKVTTNGLTP
jgi:hypothetical protein